MITALDIYLVTRCDAIKNLLEWITLISVFCSIVLLIAAGCMLSDSDFHKMTKLVFKLIYFVTFPIAVFSCSLNVLTPKSNEVAAMIVIPKIANREEIKDCCQHIYQLAVEWMDELRPTKKGNQK